MNKQTTTIDITILDKEYRISCAPEEVDGLHDSAKYLNDEMQKIKRESGLTGGERIAVLCALNLTNDYLACKQEKEEYAMKTTEVLLRMQSKLKDNLDAVSDQDC